MRRWLMGAGALVRLAYGTGALLAPEQMSARRLAPDVRGHPAGRMDFRGFGGLHVNIAALTLCAAARDRATGPVLALNLGCELSDLAATVLEWRDRGGGDRVVRGSLLVASAGLATWTAALAASRGHKYCTVTSYKRSGDPMATPVWFGVADGRLYFRTLDGAAKLRRIARNPDVLVAPCTARGRPRGPSLPARARILDAAEVDAAERHIQANYSAGRRAYEWTIRDKPARYVEVTPVAAVPAWMRL